MVLITKLSQSSSVQYHFNEEISIDSYIQIICTRPSSTKYQWTILNCTLICSTLHDLNKKIATTFNEIYIPAKTLTYGSYQLTLTVVVTTGSSDFNSSTSIHIEIVRSSNVLVNSIQYGASEITLGQTEDLLLEPGKYSLYMDGTALIPYVSQREDPSTDFHFFLFF